MSSSVLEAEPSSASSDSSPALAAAESDRRMRARPVQLEEELSDGDTDELEQQQDEQEEDVEEAAAVEREPAASRRPSRRLGADLTDLTPSPPLSSGGPRDSEHSSASPSSTRYSLRTRRSKPKRFDESIYNDVFPSSRSKYVDATPESAQSKKRKRRDRFGRKKSRARKKSRRRLLEEEDGDDDEEEEEEGDDQFAQEEGDLSMDEINRKIRAQERKETEAKAQEARRPRSQRYSLRSRESLVTLSEMNGALAPTGSSRRGAKHSPLDLSVVTGHAEADQDGLGHDGDADEESQSDNEDANSEEEQEDEEDGDEGPAGSTRYRLRRRSQTQHSLAMGERRGGDRQAASSSVMTTRSRTRNGPAPPFVSDGTPPRYSLRDRSKMHRADAEEDALAPAEASAYVEYHKRQSNNRAGASRKRGATTSASGTNRRRLFLPNLADSPPPSRRRRDRGRSRHSRGRRDRRRRSLSSSSSGSSSSDMLVDDDDSDGGMRTSSPWRASSNHGRKGGSARADITPIEVDRSITWESVGGLKTHIESLKEMVMLPLLYPEFYEKYNVTPPSGVLFYGPPGTGKTLLARALANSCSVYGDDTQAGAENGGGQATQEGRGQQRPRRHVTFYMRKGADCLSKWVGEAERQLRLLFEEAKRNQPSIIFFDEIDGLAPVRSAKQDQIHASIVSTLLALMDGMDSRGRVVVIGATNRLDAIDPALRRPGRFDRELGFKLPNVSERKSMLAIHSKHWNPPLSDQFLTELAEQTVGYCGADVKALCAEAALCSLRRVYPQVYASQDKLLINLDKVVVARGDFTKARKKITPASHRAVSSFAAPLPRAVKGLLQGSLLKVLRDMASQFPLFPMDQLPVDAAAGNDADAASDDDEVDVDIYAIVNHDDCDVCHGGSGELLCCDACPGAFHRACLVSEASTAQEAARQPDASVEMVESGLWFCPDCLASNPAAIKKARQRAQKKHVHSIASLHLPRHSGFPRVLITGKAGMGQQYVGPALLHALEGLTHFSLDYSSLVADTNAHHPEEALIRRLREAQKCVPCVLYLPHAELWWQNTSDSMHLALKMLLMDLQVRANLPILFLATTSSSFGDGRRLPEELLALFQEDPSVRRTAIVTELDAPSKIARLAHFEQVFNSIMTPPPRKSRTPRTKDQQLEVLPLAPVPAKPAQRQLSPEEELKRQGWDMHYLRELRIFLSNVLDYCNSLKLYTPFYVPVDPLAVPNYYLIVQRPMDLSTMREKLNDEEYTCFEQFMDDIQLIVRNANVFNPKRSATRHIAHAAGTMKDNILSYAHRFRLRQGYDLFAKCRDVTKRLRANPTMYGKYGRQYLKLGSRAVTSRGNPSAQDKTHVGSLQDKPEGVRVSARLRGLKAPEVSLTDVVSHTAAIEPRSNPTASNGSAEVATKQESTSEARGTNDKESATQDRDSPPVLTAGQQWFDEEDDEEEKEEASEMTPALNDIAEPDEEEGDEGGGEEDEDFADGDRVFVSSRTYPGVNREGGAAVVQGRNRDGTYSVKYVLGGSEKAVAVKYIKRLTDDAVMNSVKTTVHQSATATATNAAAAVRLIQDEEKMDETDYFDELLWPILKEVGWTRVDNFDIIEASDKEAGLAVQHVVFNTGRWHEGADATLNGVLEAIAYINAVPELAELCFGTRYSEGPLMDKALGGTSSEEATAEAAAASTGQKEADLADEKPSAPPEQAEAEADEAMPPAQDEEEAPDFIYDEARMARVLQKLVAKTALWTVDALRDELLALHSLAYPFRSRFDRRALMLQIEARVELLG